MEQVPISADLKAIFATLTQPVELEDEDGTTLGYFIPRSREGDMDVDLPTTFLDQRSE
jgi:hypothetical protein